MTTFQERKRIILENTLWDANTANYFGFQADAYRLLVGIIRQTIDKEIVYGTTKSPQTKIDPREGKDG